MAHDGDAVVGCILAGGRSSRFGGGDKCLAMLGGVSLLDRVAATLAPQVGAMVLSANGDPARFARHGLPVLPDGVGDFAGPLAGLLAALDYAAAERPDAAFVATVAADTPFFPDVLVDALLDEAAGRTTVAVAASESGRHPVFALVPVALREDLRAFLAAGATLKVGAFLDRHAPAVVRFPPLSLGDVLVDPFFNINTPADLDAARTVAALIDSARTE